MRDKFYRNLSIEQPIHNLDFEGHRYLREALRIPVIMNETLVSPQAALQIVRHDAADRVVLKHCRVGGLRPAMKIVHVCEAAWIGGEPRLAYREGWAAGLAVADDLQGRLPPPARHVAVQVADPIRFITPGRLAVPGRPPGPLHLKLRMARPARGRFHLLVDGRRYWSSRRTTAMPERRIAIRRSLPELDDVGHLELIFEERGGHPDRS